jgi:hypothetical protein
MAGHVAIYATKSSRLRTEPRFDKNGCNIFCVNSYSLPWVTQIIYLVTQIRYLGFNLFCASRFN